MKKILVAALMWPLLALAQSYPSPHFNNLTVDGTLNAGTIGLTNPLPIGSGGTGSATAVGATSNLQYNGGGTGAISRSLTSKLGDISSSMDVGADPTGINDSSTAFSNLFSRTSGYFYTPSGTYKLGSNFIPTVRDVTYVSDPSVQYTGTGKFQFDNILPYQTAPIFASNVYRKTYTTAYDNYQNIFLMAAHAVNSTTSAPVVAVYGTGEAASSGGRAFGANFTGFVTANGGRATGVEIDAGYRNGATTGHAYGLTMSAGGAVAPDAAIQVQSNNSTSQWGNGLNFSFNSSPGTGAVTGALIRAGSNGGSATVGNFLLATSDMSASSAEVDFPSFRVEATPPSVTNRVSIKGAATGVAPQLKAVGTDTNVPLNLVSQGNGVIQFTTNGVENFRVQAAAGVDNLQVGAGTGAASLSARGSSTDVNVVVAPKGAGTIQLNGPTSVSNGLTVTGAVSGAGFSTYLASPPAIGSTAPSTGAFTTLSATTSNPSLNYLSSGSSASARTYLSKFGDIVSVKDFGATGNGSTNDTAAITAADTYARSIGAVLYFPAGTYMVSQLVVQTGSNWVGDGRQSTIIKEIIGSNLDLIYGVNSNSNWGSSTPSGYAVGYTIRNITINQNWNTGSGNTSGSCLAVYGPRPILENVFITNCAEYGMRTEYTDSSNGGTDTFTMEGYLENVKIDTTGKHGWWNNGPHDTVTVGLQVVDAGLAATGTYDGLYFDAKSTGRNIGTHVWSRAASNRMAYDLILLSGANHEFTGGCNFEGANTVVNIQGQNNIFDKSTRYYAAWNGTTILFSGTGATRNIVQGYLDAPGSGRPATVGIAFGASAGDFVADNTIDVKMNGQENGNLFFNSTYDGGYNRIKVDAFNTTTASISGTPNTLDDIDVLIHNSGGMSHINNRNQCGQITTAANASGTYTYPYAFSATPIVTFSPQGPGGSLTSGMWISSVSATSATIFNNNSVSTTTNVCARATN